MLRFFETHISEYGLVIDVSFFTATGHNCSREDIWSVTVGSVSTCVVLALRLS